MKTMERRFVKGAEVRALESGHIAGHAAVFNQEYTLYSWGDFELRETIKPGAFGRALRESDDVRCLFNHNADNILGRSAAGTLAMKEDSSGLYYDCDAPDTQLGRDVRTSIKRRDITGCSFAFMPTKQSWRDVVQDGKTIRFRDIEEVELYDVGPVTYPAYEGTDVDARSLEMRAARVWPQGLPEDVIEHCPELRELAKVHAFPKRDNDGDADDCECMCRACYGGDCEECSANMEECGDPDNCRCMDSRSVKPKQETREDVKTKRVDGEDLPASAFLYVGDKDKTDTWALPYKFSSDAKTKSHLRNALARFNQTKKIPADKKAGIYKKLVRLCKKYGIHVSDKEANSWKLTTEQRAMLTEQRDQDNGECDCDCQSCKDGDCQDCADPDCDDENCDHDDPSDMEIKSEVVTAEERDRLLARIAEVSN